MAQNKILNVHNRQEFRDWLTKNSLIEKECFLVLKRGKPTDPKVFYYLDAVEEALCFGWIDSVLKNIDGKMVQRFSPRTKNSPWSALNRERVKRLIKLGLMTEEGLKVFPKEELVDDVEVINALKEAECYGKFLEFPVLYQKIRIYNVSFYKTIDKKMYKKSLDHLIEKTQKGEMFGQWNDYGRLLSY